MKQRSGPYWDDAAFQAELFLPLSPLGDDNKKQIRKMEQSCCSFPGMFYGVQIPSQEVALDV